MKTLIKITVLFMLLVSCEKSILEINITWDDVKAVQFTVTEDCMINIAPIDSSQYYAILLTNDNNRLVKKGNGWGRNVFNKELGINDCIVSIKYINNELCHEIYYKQK